jgi:hypothetical protein
MRLFACLKHDERVDLGQKALLRKLIPGADKAFGLVYDAENLSGDLQDLFLAHEECLDE